MTVFRVNISRDKAKVVKTFTDDKELLSAISQWTKVGQAYQTMMWKDGKKVIAMSRQVYAITDQRLKKLSKDKSAPKLDIKVLMELRKSSYDFTLALKKFGVA